MILKRPFAFFIKHFRLIHLILVIVTAYLTYNTINIISFFNEYMQSTASLIDKDVTAQLFPFVIFIFLFAALIASTVILVLMKWKNKPIGFYVINIISNVYTWGIYIYSSQIVKTLETSFMDLRTLKLIHDLLIITLLFQTVSIIVTVIRTTGFDIKKFNFEDDFDLKIDESDNEEFEFDVAVDTDEFKRNIKKSIRNIKYIYKENKLSIILTSLIIMSITFAFIYVNSGVYNKVYKAGNMLRTTYFSFGVVDSYVTNKDYHDNKITDDNLVVVKVRARNMAKYDMKLETAKIALVDGNVAYYSNSNYQGKFIDLGSVYVNDDVSQDKFKDYLLVFEVPADINTEKLYLKYYDNKDKTITIALKPKNLNTKSEPATYNLKDKVNFNDSILGDANLSIDSMEISDRFKENYKYCVSSNECYNSYEYIVPTVSDNYNKKLLKLTGGYSFNEKIKVNNISSLGEFISAYGKINYKVDNEERTMNAILKQVLPQKIKSNSTYLEVYDDIADASDITLVITIRNKVYKYKLK